MLYSWEITIPANTPESSPKTKVLKLTKGVITQVIVHGRWGQRGYVKVRLLHEESQLVPLTRREWITTSGMPKVFQEYYELKTRPYKLKFQGHSEGSSYDHKVNIDIVVLPRNVASMIRLIELLEKFFKRIGLIR